MRSLVAALLLGLVLCASPSFAQCPGGCCPGGSCPASCAPSCPCGCQGASCGHGYRPFPVARWVLKHRPLRKIGARVLYRVTHPFGGRFR